VSGDSSRKNRAVDAVRVDENPLEERVDMCSDSSMSGGRR